MAVREVAVGEGAPALKAVNSVPSSDAPPERERWSSNTAFIFAAIGTAIGLGNLWRFPATTAEYGGGSFFLPYFIAFFFIGTPMLILEVGLGQYFQGGSTIAYGNISPRFRMMGAAQGWISCCLLFFYVPLIAWFVRMLFYSFTSDADGFLPWGTDEYVYSKVGAWSWSKVEIFGNPEKNAIESFDGVSLACLVVGWFCTYISIFFGVKITGLISMVTVLLPCFMIFALLVYSCTLDGALYGVTNYIGKWDMSVLNTRPDIWSKACAQIFFSLSVTFGMMTAFGSYSDSKDNVAKNCCTISSFNSLYSIIAGFAVFSAMGNLQSMKELHLRELVTGASKESPAAALTFDTKFTPIENQTYSFDLPFFVCAQDLDGKSCLSPKRFEFDEKKYQTWFKSEVCSHVLSYKSNGQCLDAESGELSTMCVAHQSETFANQFSCDLAPGQEQHPRVKLAGDRLMDAIPSKNDGPALAFGTYPVILSKFQGGHFWNVLLFFTFFLLGVDSAFGLLEGVVTMLMDTAVFAHVSRKKMTSITTIVFIIATSPFCTDEGFTLLDVVDYYLNIVLLILGLAEVVAVGWCFQWEKTVKKCGLVPSVALVVSIFGSSLLGVLSGYGIGFGVGVQPHAIPTGAGILFGFLAAGLALTCWLQSMHGDETMDYRSRVTYLFFGNLEDLRDNLNSGYLKHNNLEPKWNRGIPKYYWAFCIKYFCTISLIVLVFNDLLAKTYDENNMEYYDHIKMGNFKGMASGWQAVGIILPFITVLLFVVGLLVPPSYTEFMDKSQNVVLRDNSSETSDNAGSGLKRRDSLASSSI